jgi:hypothetical protein
MSVAGYKVGAMHQIIELDYVEDRDGRPRIAWLCECGSRGSGTTQKTAADGWKRHARNALRKEYE